MSILSCFFRRRPKPIPEPVGPPELLGWERVIGDGIGLLEQEIHATICIGDLEEDLRRLVPTGPPLGISTPGDGLRGEIADRASAFLLAGQAQFLRIATRAAVQIIDAHRPTVAARLSADDRTLPVAREALAILRQLQSEHALR